MQWKDDYSLQIPEIDKEHQILADCITEIEEAVSAGERWLVVHSAIGKLIYLARTHFILEETLMRIQSYADIETHIGSHNDFLAKLKDMESASLNSVLSEESVAQLHTWLVEHIVSDDKQYAAALSNSGRKLARKYYP